MRSLPKHSRFTVKFMSELPDYVVANRTLPGWRSSKLGCLRREGLEPRAVVGDLGCRRDCPDTPAAGWITLQFHASTVPVS